MDMYNTLVSIFMNTALEPHVREEARILAQQWNTVGGPHILNSEVAAFIYEAIGQQCESIKDNPFGVNKH